MAISIDEIVLFGGSPSCLGLAYLSEGRLVDVHFEQSGPRLLDVYLAQLKLTTALEGAFAVVSQSLSILVKDTQGKTEGQKVAVQLIKEPFGDKTWTGKLVPFDHEAEGDVGTKIKSGPSLIENLPNPCPRLVVTSTELLARFRDRGAIKEEEMLYVIQEQVLDAIEPVVNLIGGGTLVIEPTQALTAIDVNMGSRDRLSQSAQAIVDCNVVAAKELARQVKLRRIAGRIVVDFIAMKNVADQRSVWETLKASFADQKAQLIGFTKAGLFEITLKRVRRPLNEEPYFDIPNTHQR